MHKKSTLLSVSVFFLLFIGLSDYGYSHHRDGHNKGGDDGGDGGGSGKSIPLIVTFRDCNGGEPPDGAPPELEICDDDFPMDAIQSDLWGPYANKEDRVVAAINKSGTFRLGVAGNSPPPIRKLFYDFSNCASKIGDPPCLPPDPELFPGGLSIGAVNWYTSGVDLRAMDVGDMRGDLGLSAELNLNNDDGGNWRILFDFNPSDLDCPDSFPVTVTHPDTDTWVIEADKDAKACLKLLDPGGVGTGEPMGLYHMPFQIMLKKK